MVDVTCGGYEEFGNGGDRFVAGNACMEELAIMALWVKVDGVKEIVWPANGKTFTLEELEAAVGGYIEIVNMPLVKARMIVNDGTPEHELKFNQNATDILRHALRDEVVEIFGDVLVCEYEDIE